MRYVEVDIPLVEKDVVRVQRTQRIATRATILSAVAWFAAGFVIGLLF